MSSRWWHGFPLALQFLTVVPVRVPADLPENGMAASLPWFPVVGVLIGSTAAILDWLLSNIFSRSICDVVVVAFLAFSTGMLHLDGFLDCCDGLLGHRPLARRLEIMRDSRVGAYGVVGGILLIVLQVAALDALPSNWRSIGIIAGVVLGRWAMVGAVTWYPYARAAGAGSSFRAGKGTWIGATTVTLLLLVGLVGVQAVWKIQTVNIQTVNINTVVQASIVVGLIALVAALGWVGGTLFLSKRLDGGLTGDTYGAINEIVTLSAWLSVPVMVHLIH